MAQTITNTGVAICENGKEPEIIGTTEIDSGEMSRMTLGIYENDFPQPEFHIDVEPKDAQVDASLVRLNDGSEYKLAYNFQNFQNGPCKITVHACASY